MRTLLGVLTLCLATTAGGQDPTEPAADHELFEREAGKWDCGVQMFTTRKGPPVRFRGVEVNKPVSGGLYLHTSLTYAMGDRKFEGHSLMGYDPRTKRYVGTWADNFTAIPRQIH